MKEQKTLNDLISYYEEELKYTNKSISDNNTDNDCEQERESNYKLFLSQLKQLKRNISNHYSSDELICEYCEYINDNQINNHPSNICEGFNCSKMNELKTEYSDYLENKISKLVGVENK